MDDDIWYMIFHYSSNQQNAFDSVLKATLHNTSVWEEKTLISFCCSEVLTN